MANAHESIFLPFSFKDIILFPEGLFSDLLRKTLWLYCTGQSNQSFGPRGWTFATSKSDMEVKLLLGPSEPR